VSHAAHSVPGAQDATAALHLALAQLEHVSAVDAGGALPSSPASSGAADASSSAQRPGLVAAQRAPQSIAHEPPQRRASLHAANAR
jgi:hypothetical protein